MDRAFHEILEILTKDKERGEKARKNQHSVWLGQKPELQPLLLGCYDKNAPSFKKHNLKEIHFDSQKMLENGLIDAMSPVFGRAGSAPSMRANMGCGIFPTLLGVEQALFEDKMPWVISHADKDTLKKMKPEDIKISREFRAALDHMEYMAEILEGGSCRIYPLDLQGAFDTAHIVYGDRIFYDLYDDPDFIHHLLDLSCHAIFIGMEEVLKRIPGSEISVDHYNNVSMPRENGCLKISEDTSTLVSKEHIDEFILPYMNRILERYNGGYIHYCGKNDHLFEGVMSSLWVRGLNFGNADKHYMDAVLRRCAKERKVFYGGCNKRPEESPRDYFTRILKGSKSEDGLFWILPNYSCSVEDRDEVTETFNNLVCSI